MSDRYDPDRAPSPWDEDGSYDPRPRRPSSSSRGGGGPRSGGRPPSGQPQPPYGQDDGNAQGYGRPARPSRPLSDYPQAPYPQPPYPSYDQQPDYGQPDGYGEYGARPRTPSRDLGRRPGGSQYGAADPYAGGRPPYGQPGGGMGDMSGTLPPPGYPDAPPMGWGDNRQQPGYGWPAQPSQGPYFPTLQDPQALAQQQYGYPGYPVTTTTRPEQPKKRRSLRWLWITLAVVVVLLAAGGGVVVWAVGQLAAPGVVAGEFCTNLSQQSYDTVYGQFSANLRAGLSQAQFHSNAADLDTAEGKVVGCRTGGNVNYSLGSSTADIGLIVTRAKQGILTGSVHLKNENGAWKVDKLDTALLGLNLGTVQAVEDYCTALQGQKYDAAYALLDSTGQSAQKLTDFTSDAKLHDQIDGTVNACALDSVASGNTDIAATVTVAITRAKLGQNSGKIALSSSGSAWKITSIDKTIQGTNLLPLAAGQKFCGLLSQAKYTDAYNSTSGGFKQATSNATFMQLFNVAGVKWTCGSPNLSTYKVVANNGTYTVALTAKDVASGTLLLNSNIEMVLVLEGSTWKVQGFGEAT